MRNEDATVTRQGRRVQAAFAAALIAFATWSGSSSQAIADPGIGISLADQAAARWDGPNANARLGALSSQGSGGMTTIREVDGDRIYGFAATAQGASPFKGAFVLTDPSAGDDRDLANLMPEDGYLIQLPGNSTQVADVGDQNGDGIPDLLTGSSAGMYVVFGVADPSSLPECSPPSPTRCLNAASLTVSQGYQLTGPTATFGTAVTSVGDYNGDDIPDFAISDNNANVNAGAIYVVFGGRTPTGSPVDVASLPADEGETIVGVPASGLGFRAGGIGDVNGDGLGDLAGYGALNAVMYVVYGSGDAGGTVDVASPPSGRVTTVTGFGGFEFNGSSPAGDVNGDGIGDYTLHGAGLPPVGNPDGAIRTIYGNEDPPATLNVTALTAEQGYTMNAPGDAASLGQVARNLGDLNGDGIPDLIASATGMTDAGIKPGAAILAFGHRPGPSSPVNLGSGLVADDGIALTGALNNSATGNGVPVGDVDQDGLPDFVVSVPSAPALSRSNAGSAYLVFGRSIIGSAVSGIAAASSESATLSGTAKSNGRTSAASFEYGLDESYGSQTAPAPIAGNYANEPVTAAIDGLQPATTYHFRLVLENDLGLKAYGKDITFTTAAAPAPPPCLADPKAPGCSEWNYCADTTPKPPECVKAARFSALVAAPRRISVKRGKSGVFTTVLANTGNLAAKKVRVCAKAPKGKARFMGGACKTIGQMGPGKTVSKNFKVKVTRKARKNKPLTVRITATAGNVKKKTTSLKVIPR